MSRSRRPKLTDRLYIQTLQRLRLEGLETGRFPPVSDREMMYLQLFRAGLRPDRNDFIVSKPLLQLEAVLMDQDAEAAADASPFTPAAEPAISPP
ncbi:MAG: hypothetical protein Q7U72_16570 [Brevundimonas sp.]|uniref:hypothetical protein n=1 Tax=Brevundimonas sp. TaxID=1871086 RepID=UPI002720BC81|nr:hypothetical protein [Brevundimonas sp.]MDO9079048.1 hypothetical protein [Brevundimonas sp.]MDP3080833.1 hypothetical protein [Brevundimonas sp.]MDZ4062382.1 hypothetical protein [Brevundimonas sp.]